MAKGKTKEEAVTAVATPMIYVFRTGSSAAGQRYAALAEDGTLLIEHVTGGDQLARHDLGAELQKELYGAHYPGGFEVVWLEHPSDDPGWKAAMDRTPAVRAFAEGAPDGQPVGILTPLPPESENL